MNILMVFNSAILTVLLANACLVTTAKASQSFTGKCLLEVNHKKYINGQCSITLEDDGSFYIGMSENKTVNYFAYISINGKNIADGDWNGEVGESHAHEPLGNLVKKGGCWENEHAKVCAWK